MGLLSRAVTAMRFVASSDDKDDGPQWQLGSLGFLVAPNQSDTAHDGSVSGDLKSNVDVGEVDRNSWAASAHPTRCTVQSAKSSPHSMSTTVHRFQALQYMVIMS